MIDEVEQVFLGHMRIAAQLKELWEAKQDNLIWGGGNANTVAEHIVQRLKLAGEALSLRPRFTVECSYLANGDRLVEITPRNGQAERMMERYKMLFLENELSKG